VRRVVAAPDEWRARCRAVAEREFSPRRVASDLARIYAAVRAGPARC